jgi:hypothetical protein
VRLHAPKALHLKRTFPVCLHSNPKGSPRPSVHRHTCLNTPRTSSELVAFPHVNVNQLLFIVESFSTYLKLVIVSFSFCFSP